MRKPKATNIEKDKRLFTIQGWILDGVADRMIIKQIMTTWNIGLRQAERYVKEAYDGWKKIEGVNLDMKREMKISELKQLRRSLKETYKGTPAGISAIMAIEKEIIKLEGIELPKTVKLELPEVDAIEFNVVYGKGKD